MSADWFEASVPAIRRHLDSASSWELLEVGKNVTPDSIPTISPDCQMLIDGDSTRQTLNSRADPLDLMRKESVIVKP